VFYQATYQSAQVSVARNSEVVEEDLRGLKLASNQIEKLLLDLNFKRLIQRRKDR
jgi:hypothetical protein